METVNEITYKGYTIKVYPEQSAENPREMWDGHLGTIGDWHRHYNIGDEKINMGGGIIEWFMGMLDFDYDQEEWWYNQYRGKDRELADALRAKMEDKYIILPVFCYEHSGITISTGSFSCSFDSGQVGYIWVSKEDVRAEYDWKQLTSKRIERVKERLRGEIQTLDDYLTGSVYWYECIAPDGREVGSCGGFYGDDEKKSGLLDYAQGDIDSDIEKVDSETLTWNHRAWNRLKGTIRNNVPLIYRQPYFGYQP